MAGDYKRDDHGRFSGDGGAAQGASKPHSPGKPAEHQQAEHHSAAHGQSATPHANPVRAESNRERIDRISAAKDAAMGANRSDDSKHAEHVKQFEHRFKEDRIAAIAMRVKASEDRVRTAREHRIKTDMAADLAKARAKRGEK